MSLPLPLIEVMSDRRLVVLGEIFVFNVSLILLVRPMGFFPQPRSVVVGRLLDATAALSLGLLLAWSVWTALILNR